MISVVIPTYRNKNQLLQNLKHNLVFLKDCELVIINDYPKESLKKDLKNLGDRLKILDNFLLLENKKNVGFGQTINIGVKHSKNKYVMLLNDDVILYDNSFKKALDKFKKDEKLFALCFAQNEKNGVVVGKNQVYWKNGMFFHQKSNNLSEGYNAWSEGGACLIDKTKFLELAGFDSLYAPFYWEDIDLSYRSWKKGYRVVFDPKIVVQHQHESTIGKYYSAGFIQTISYQNQFIFIWKNITDINLILNHILYLPLNLIYYGLIKHNLAYAKGFLGAIKKIKAILTKRSKNRPAITDKELLQNFL